MVQIKSQERPQQRFALSPGLIGGGIVHFLASGTRDFYFMRHDDSESYLTDCKGKYVLTHIDAVKEARELYLVAFEHSEIKQERLKPMLQEAVMQL